jgi:hypothetical protein
LGAGRGGGVCTDGMPVTADVAVLDIEVEIPEVLEGKEEDGANVDVEDNGVVVESKLEVEVGEVTGFSVLVAKLN